MGSQGFCDKIEDPNIIEIAESDMIFKHLPPSAIKYLSFKMPYRIVHLDTNSKHWR